MQKRLYMNLENLLLILYLLSAIKYSEEKATSAFHMVMPFSTLLEKRMPQMLQVGFFLFCFIFPFHMLLDMCISSISHHISSREKAESDSGAPQSEKTGT